MCRPLREAADGRANSVTPLMRSPSRWHSRVPVATSAGRSAICVMWGGSGSVDLSPATEAGAPDAAWPTVRGAGCRVTACQSHRDTLRQEVCPPVVTILASEASGNLCG